MIYFEAEFDNGDSICCRGKRLPTIAEANIFCAADVKINGEVVSVVEISVEERFVSRLEQICVLGFPR